MAIHPKYLNTQLPVVYDSGYVPNWGNPIDTFLPSTVLTNPAPRVVTPIEVASKGVASKGAGIKGWFSNHFGPGKTLFGSNGTAGDFFENANNVRNNVLDTSLFKGGPTIAQSANIVNAGMQGAQAVQGLSSNMQSNRDYSDLKKDIISLKANNPMYSTYLDPEDERILRELNSNTLKNNIGNSTKGIISSIPKALLNAGLGFLTGNAAGAAIGGLGTLANGAISGYGQGTEEANAKLQGLYSRLKQADEERRSMMRPSGLSRAGLQSRYYNQLY